MYRLPMMKAKLAPMVDEIIDTTIVSINPRPYPKILPLMKAPPMRSGAYGIIVIFMMT